MSKELLDSRSYMLGWWDSARQNGSDKRFSTALFKAAEDEHFELWFSSISEELNYAMHNMTDHNELLDFDYQPLLHRQIFLQLAALSMRDEGL